MATTRKCSAQPRELVLRSKKHIYLYFQITLPIIFPPLEHRRCKIGPESIPIRSLPHLSPPPTPLPQSEGYDHGTTPPSVFSMFNFGSSVRSQANFYNFYAVKKELNHFCWVKVHSNSKKEFIFWFPHGNNSQRRISLQVVFFFPVAVNFA